MGAVIQMPPRTMPAAALPSAGRLPTPAPSALADSIHLTRVAEILRQCGAGHPMAHRSAALMRLAAALDYLRGGDADRASAALDMASALWAGRQA